MSTRSSHRRTEHRAHPRPAPSRAAGQWVLWAAFVLHLVIGVAGPLVHSHWRGPGGDSVVTTANPSSGDHLVQDEASCEICDALASVAAPGILMPEVQTFAVSRSDAPATGRAPPSLSVPSPSARGPPAA